MFTTLFTFFLRFFTLQNKNILTFCHKKPLTTSILAGLIVHPTQKIGVSESFCPAIMSHSWELDILSFF